MIKKDSKSNVQSTKVITISDYYTVNCSEQKIVEVNAEIFTYLNSDKTGEDSKERDDRRKYVPFGFDEMAIAELNEKFVQSAEEEYFRTKDEEQISRIKKIFSKLTHCQRERLYNHVVLKMTFKEISEREGVSISSIQKSYELGIKKLRNHGEVIQNIALDKWGELLK